MVVLFAAISVVRTVIPHAMAMHVRVDAVPDVLMGRTVTAVEIATLETAETVGIAAPVIATWTVAV